MVERARAREQQAFAILFEHYKTKIYTYITRLVRNDGIAHDLAQETFFKAWLALPELHNPASFKPWLYRIATCEAHKHLRQARPIDHLSWEEEETPPHQCLIVDGPEKQVEEAELTKCILAQLSLQHRTCLLLTLAGALRFLRLCLNSDIVDTLRAQLRSEEMPWPEPGFPEEPAVEDRDERNERWEAIRSFLQNPREQRLAYLLYYCNLKPRQIVQFCPNEFSNVSEIFRLTRNIVDRLRRNKDRLRWLLSGIEF